MTDKRILIAFILNIIFSIFEFLGGILTNSISIISDSVHDFGDAISIGLSYVLEKISKRDPDNKYTYGYIRYSVLGALITNIILITGSILVIISSINRFINPVSINYDGMIIFAIFGVIVNFIATLTTKDGHSLNQKAVNLHMLEDCLGWIVVLIGAIVIKFTKVFIIDAILSFCVAIFIFINAIYGLKNIVDLFLEKTPSNIDIEEIRKHLFKIKNIKDVHHIHIWSLDGFSNFATMHIVTDLKDTNKLKREIKEELREHNINHSTIEIENTNYDCDDINCNVEHSESIAHHHHHH